MRIYVERENHREGIWMKLPASREEAEQVRKEQEKRHPSIMTFIEIDADENVIRIDEDRKEERQYHEYPLDLLIGKAKEVVGINPYSGYESLNRDRLYREMRQAVTAGIGRETGREMGGTGGTKERDAAQEQMMQDESGQDEIGPHMAQEM